MSEMRNNDGIKIESMKVIYFEIRNGINDRVV